MTPGSRLAAAVLLTAALKDRLGATCVIERRPTFDVKLVRVLAREPLPELLRGSRVLLSPNVPSGKVVVADTAHLELLIVDDLTIEIGYVNDDFTKNVATMLGEIRVIPTFRGFGSVRVITRSRKRLPRLITRSSAVMSLV